MPPTTLTDRQLEIKQLLDKGLEVRDVADRLGVTRNAIYLQIAKMRDRGALPDDFTVSGVRHVRTAPGEARLRRLLAETTDEPQELAAAGALALLQELQRTRDELDAISRRLSLLLPS